MRPPCRIGLASRHGPGLCEGGYCRFPNRPAAVRHHAAICGVYIEKAIKNCLAYQEALKSEMLNGKIFLDDVELSADEQKYYNAA